MSEYKQLAVEAAKEVGDLLTELSKQDIKYEMKDAFDILAEADLKSEKIIIDKIKAKYPDHDILSEEAGREKNGSEFLWIIDPIDGTINFSRHMEDHCISIALSQKGQLIMGVIYQPMLGKMYVAEKGEGAFLNDKQIHVSPEVEIVNTIAAVDLTSKHEARKDVITILDKISKEVRHIRIFGSSALHLARMAEGQIDFYVKPDFNYWDYAAATIILEEAGGKVTDFEGNPIGEDSQNIVASNKILHQAVQDLIK